MKKMCTALILVLVLNFFTGCASQGINGVGIGAVAGAISGQAIGKNTESTLIGASIGTFLGYMGGNEIDKYRSNYRTIPRHGYVPQQYQQYSPQQYRQPPQQNWRSDW